MRHQLPVYSPLRLGSILGASAEALFHPDDSRDELVTEVRDRFAADEVLLTASGTHALQVALSRIPAVGGRGRVVAMPGYSCFDLVSAGVWADVKIRFYDVDPVTLAPDLDSVRAVLNEGVTALVAGSLYGYPVDSAALFDECDAAGVVLIEDAAQGVGSGDPTHANRARFTVLSFGRGKGWTGGSGGALLIRNPPGEEPPRSPLERPARLEGPRSAAVTLGAWLLGRPSLYAVPSSLPGLGLGDTHYREPTPPRAISGFAAALALRTSTLATEAIERRRRLAAQWESALSEQATRDLLTPCQPLGGGNRATFLRLPCLAVSATSARDLAGAMRHFGVARGYPVPLSRLPQATTVSTGGIDLPGCERLATTLVTLPTHGWVGDSEIRDVTEVLSRKALQGA